MRGFGENFPTSAKSMLGAQQNAHLKCASNRALVIYFNTEIFSLASYLNQMGNIAVFDCVRLNAASCRMRPSDSNGKYGVPYDMYLISYLFSALIRCLYWLYVGY